MPWLPAGRLRVLEGDGRPQLRRAGPSPAGTSAARNRRSQTTLPTATRAGVRAQCLFVPIAFRLVQARCDCVPRGFLRAMLQLEGINDLDTAGFLRGEDNLMTAIVDI